MPLTLVFLTVPSFLMASFHVSLAKSTGLGFRLPRVKFHSQDAWPGASHITLLYISFQIYKIIDFL